MLVSSSSCTHFVCGRLHFEHQFCFLFVLKLFVSSQRLHILTYRPNTPGDTAMPGEPIDAAAPGDAAVAGLVFAMDRRNVWEAACVFVGASHHPNVWEVVCVGSSHQPKLCMAACMISTCSTTRGTGSIYLTPYET